MKLHGFFHCKNGGNLHCHAWLPLEGKCFESKLITISEHFKVYRFVPMLLHARANASTVCDIFPTWLYSYIQDIRSCEYLGPGSCCCFGAPCCQNLPLPFGSNLLSSWLQLPIGVAVVKELFVRFHGEKAVLANMLGSQGPATLTGQQLKTKHIMCTKLWFPWCGRSISEKLITDLFFANVCVCAYRKM